MKQNFKDRMRVIEYIYTELLAKGNLEAYEQIVAENIHVHCPKSWGQLHQTETFDRQTTRQIDQQYTQAFQYKDVDFGDVLANQDKVSVRWECKGRHIGDFFGFKTTNRDIEIEGQTCFRFNAEGQIQEVWQSWDMLGLLRQIGCELKQTVSPPAAASGVDLRKAALLSTREKECLKLLLQGMTAKETAEELNLSGRTVEFYFENIKNKLDCMRKKELFSVARWLDSRSLL